MSTIAQQLAALAQIKADIKAAIEDKGVTVGSVAFDEYANLIASISSGYSSEDIKNLIARSSSFTSFTLPSGITAIGNSAFRYCSALTSITIPSGVTSIGASAFERCSGLTSVTIPSGVASIGADAFHYCSKIVSLTIPDTVTSIGNYCFSDCTSLTSLTLSPNLTTMGVQTLYNCAKLPYVDIPSGVKSFGNYFFYSCKLLSTIIVRSTTPPTVTSNTFGNGTGSYTGTSVASGKKLYVPKNCSSAYNTSYWASVLLDSSKCNFTIYELDEDGNIPT